MATSEVEERTASRRTSLLAGADSPGDEPERETPRPAPRTSLLTEIRRLTGTAAVYGFGMLLLRGINYALLPLLTHALGGEEYGLVSLAAAVTAIMAVILPLGCDAALAKFYFGAKSDTERADAVWTNWVTFSVASIVLAGAFDLFGEPLSRAILPGVPFHPYLRMALWCAVFQAQVQFYCNLLRNRMQPKRYVLVTMASTLLSAGLMLSLVVVVPWGAEGYLLGRLGSAAFIGFIAAALIWKTSHGAFRRDLVPQIMRFGLPLVPHLLCCWLIAFSDRALLERYLSLRDVGLYSVGYQVGALVGSLATCLNSAWSPHAFKRLEESPESAPREIARLTTFYYVGMCWFCLGIMLFSRQIVGGLASPEFAEAARFVPWIAAAQLVNALYLVPSNMLFIRGRNIYVSLAVFAAALINCAANVLFIPRFGSLAAAWTTFASYLVMSLLVYLAGQRYARLPYEWRRLAGILAVFAAFVFLGEAIPSDAGRWEVLLRIAVLIGFLCPSLACAAWSAAPSPDGFAIRELARRTWARLSARLSS